MAGQTQTRMEQILANRYAPLILPNPLSAMPTGDYQKYMPKFTGAGEYTAEEHIEEFYAYAENINISEEDARAPITNNIPFLGDHKVTYESVGVGLLKDSSFMGTFPTPLPPTTHHIATVNMISTMDYQSLESSNPWIVPSSMY
jgi:hypothetical protein